MLMQVFSRLAKANMNKLNSHEPWSFVYEFRNGMWAWTLNVDANAITHATLEDVVQDYNEQCADRPWLRIGLAEIMPLHEIFASIREGYSRMIFMPLEDAAYGMLFMGFERISTQPSSLIYIDQETCQSWSSIRRLITREVPQSVE